MALHKDLTGADLHEPKGVSSATSGQVYEADGAGSGVWTTLVIPTGTFYTTTQVFTASGTWTKPANLFLARVHCIGGGGNGRGSASGNGTSTSGGTTTFTGHNSATGGGGGTMTTGAPTGGTAGSGSGGDLNLTGFVGNITKSDGTPAYNVAPGGFGVKGTGEVIADGTASAGGGTGGYSRKDIVDADLAATVAVTISTAAQNNGYVVVEEFISL